MKNPNLQNFFLKITLNYSRIKNFIIVFFQVHKYNLKSKTDFFIYYVDIYGQGFHKLSKINGKSKADDNKEIKKYNI